MLKTQGLHATINVHTPQTSSVLLEIASLSSKQLVDQALVLKTQGLHATDHLNNQQYVEDNRCQ